MYVLLWHANKRHVRDSKNANRVFSKLGMFPLHYVEVPKGSFIKWQRIVITHIMVLCMNKENAVFNPIVWIHTSLKEIMLFENTKEHYSDGGVCGWVRWESLNAHPLSSTTVSHQCTLVWWQVVGVFYLIPVTTAMGRASWEQASMSLFSLQY